MGPLDGNVHCPATCWGRGGGPHQVLAALLRVIVLLQPAARELDSALAAEHVPQAVAGQQHELVLRLQRVAHHLRATWTGLRAQGSASWTGLRARGRAPDTRRVTRQHSGLLVTHDLHQRQGIGLRTSPSAWDETITTPKGFRKKEAHLAGAALSK